MMAQSIIQVCTNCGNAVPATMRFCPNCGTPASTGANNSDGYAPTQKTPPPYAAYLQQQPPQPVYQPAPGQQGYQPSLQQYQPAPTYAQPQKKAGGGILRVGVILLLILVLLGAGGYFAFRYVNGRVIANATTGTNNASKTTQAPLTTTPINATVNYASVDVTVVNAQQATSFADDTQTPAQGVVRLNLHAVQVNTDNVYSVSAPAFAYPESFVLLLPGGNKVTPGDYKDISGPARQGVQTTWIDFPAPASLKVSQMTLQIGKDTEEQIQVPLTGHANLSKYQPKQSTPNLRVQFGNLFWTLKKVTFKLSDSGTQVDKNMRFLVLAFSIDNPGTDGNNGYGPDCTRLQYNGTTITSEQLVIGNIDANTTNIQGLISFLVPQDTTAATFILLPGHTPGATSQATIPIQIP
ncbi:MAG TPA: zinc ribbon domain-containing protein [Ktedonobacteraceae bacterium]